ncbi:MAG: SPOR domain-containing protein [Nitrospirae bacterium]|nr:SPOR domain-containing protein [Magnetococcales bacterium]
MTPRYPTHNRYRRRTNKSPITVVLLGLVAGGGGYLLFGDHSSKPVVQTIAPITALPEKTDSLDIVTEKVRNVLVKESKKEVKANVLEKEPKKEVKTGESDQERGKKRTIEEKVDLTAVLEAGNRHLALKTSEAMAIPARTASALQPVATKPVGVIEKTEPTDDAVTDEVAKEKKIQDLPPLPQDLTPKVRPPEVELTFYDTLANRKVILPLDTREQVVYSATHANPPVKPQLPGMQTRPGVSASPTASTNPTTQKKNQDISALIENSLSAKSSKNNPGSDAGPYMVQLAVFSNYDRAAQMVSQLQRKGRVAHMVHSDGASGPVYRVRTGPYPSMADAKVAMEALPTDGQSPVIIKPPPR